MTCSHTSSTGTPSCRASFLGARQSNAFTSPPAFQREGLVHHQAEDQGDPGEGVQFIQGIVHQKLAQVRSTLEGH